MKMVNVLKFKETGIGPIPGEWDIVDVRSVTEFVGRGVTPSYTDAGVVVLNQKCIREGKVSFDESRFTDPNVKKIPEQKFLKDYDILINSTGQGTLGRVGQVKFIKEKMTVDSHVSIVRAINKKINPLFLGFYLKSIQPQIEAMAEGSTGQTELAREKIANILVPLPVGNEQKQIAEILSSLDDKIELNRRMNKTLEEMAQALFKRWFVDFEFPNKEGKPYRTSGGTMVKDAPEGWRALSLFDLVDVMSGGTPKTNDESYWNGNIPFFTPKDAGPDLFAISAEKYLSEEGIKNCNSQLYPVNTIFITARGTVGKIALAGVPMAMNQSCYALKGKNGFGQLFSLMLIKRLTQELQNKTHGSVFDSITIDTFRNTSFVAPNIELTNEFDKTVRPLFDRLLLNTLENNSLEKIRDSLLPRLMSGKIRV